MRNAIEWNHLNLLNLATPAPPPLPPPCGYTPLCADQFETSTSPPPPPRAYPGHLTVHRARGGGNLNIALKGWGI